jgi:hypothetical protein
MENLNKNRQQILLRIAPSTMSLIDIFAKRKMGIGRNAFFSLSALLLLTKLTGTIEGKKRMQIIKDLEETFKIELEKARKAL